MRHKRTQNDQKHPPVEPTLLAQPARLTLNYCLNNVDAQGHSLLRACEFQTIADVCLQRCGDCYADPFLVVDGQLVSGESHQALLQALCDQPCRTHPKEKR